jgi:hypothetical protein
MIDPVVLAGRKNYFGFYGNIGWEDRTPAVRRIYGGDKGTAAANGISYILVPKWQKSDFPYEITMSALRKNYVKAYEDNRYIVFAVR